jgi:D-alanyl-D-alanine dipeptidase
VVDLWAVDPRIVTDVRYATTNNFTGQKLYPVPRCMLRESVALRLRLVQDQLVKRGLGLKVYDGYRPRSVQEELWKIMPDPDYVAPPQKGSRHNRGGAVDLTLVDAEGKELEMPTPFDSFAPAARADYAGGTATSRKNRDMLIKAMRMGRFRVLATEWWHFDAPGWENYPVLDVPLVDEGNASTRKQ